MMNTQKAGTAEEHPSPEALLLAIEGELPEGQAASVSEHLKICWECRTESEELQNGIFAFMDYRKVILPGIKVPPRQWSDFRHCLDQAAEEYTGPSPIELASMRVRFVMNMLRSVLRPFFSSYMRPARTPSLAVVIIVVLLIIYRFISSPVVSAQELLLRASEFNRAATRGISNPVIHQKIRIRSGNRSITRDLVRGSNSRQLHAAAASIPLPPSREMQNELRQLFLTHHLNWDDPLSAERFADWHDSLATKRDRVNRTGAGSEERIILNTTTSSDPVIRDASFTVLARNWHPVEERLRLADDTEIEIAELLFEVRNGVPDVTPPTALLPAAGSIPKPLPGPSLAELSDIEVATRYALHRVGADLGEPIQVVRSSRGKVEVRGLVDTRARKAELNAVLQGIPHLSVQVQTPEEAVGDSPGSLGHASTLSSAADRPSSQTAADNTGVASEEERPGSRDVVIATRLPIHDLLEKCFAEKRCARDALSAPGETGQSPQQNLDQEVQRFSNQAVSLSDGALAEAWALRRLADHYQPHEVALLKGSSLQLLRVLLQDHLSALQRHVVSETALITPVPFFTGNPEPAATGAGQVGEPPSRWPGGIYEIFRDAELVQQNTATLFAGSAQLSSTDVQILARDLEAALARLNVALARASQQTAELFPKE